MIKLRFQTMEKSDRDLEISILEGELVSEMVPRVLQHCDLGELKPEDIFHVVVNGHIIPADMWSVTKTSESDTVLVCPRLTGGETGQLFKQFAIAAATIAAYAVFGPGGAAFGPLALGLSVAAVSIGSTLLLNSLIPPPEVGGLNLDGPQDVEKSQMYSVTGQGNKAIKFGSVPRVYGTHRMFPNVASNPYTELQSNPESGQMEQYLYAIYDFGFGPLQISNIMIGETPIELFEDAQYRLVDLNKPAVNEGVWDEPLVNSFAFYKGDPQAQNLSITIDGNRDAGDAINTYQINQVTSANNPAVTPQEITLTFANTKGLISYSATGEVAPRSINLQIEFAKVGTENWKAFNDLGEVHSFSSKGGDLIFNLSELVLPACDKDGGLVWTLLFTSERESRRGIFDYLYVYRTRYFGLPAGAPGIHVYNPTPIPEGTFLTHKEEYLGKVKTCTPWGLPGGPNWFLTFTEPLDRQVRLFTAKIIDFDGPDPYNGQLITGYVAGPLYSDLEVYQKVFRGSPNLGRAVIKKAQASPVFSSFKFTPREPGQYKIRVTRISTTSPFTQQVLDSLTLVGITTRFDTNPIVTTQRHLFLELKIRVTNQLNGVVQNLSAICTSVLPVYNGTEWVMQETKNPAWVFADLLTGTVNKRAVSKSRLNLPSLMEWAAYCDAIPASPPTTTFYRKRFESNFILDYNITLQGVLNQVGGSAQASLNIVDGKYGVLIDRKRDIPVQIFTPRNSTGFASSRIYADRPDAVRIIYIDPALGWETSEVIVYDDGFDEGNAVRIDDLTSFACTNNEQAWRFGRYMIAQNRLRQETMTITVDFEYLVCSRGDYVQITQDVMKVGGTPARVRSVVGNRVLIDEKLEIDLSLDYAYTSRGSDGVIQTNSLTVVSNDTFDLVGDVPKVGDLIIIGEAGKVVFDCLVKSIRPNDDLTATLNLIEKADGVYEAESTSDFPAYNPQISRTSDPATTAPGMVENFTIVDQGYECDGEGYLYFVDLDWDVPSSSVFELFEVYANSGQGYNLVAQTKQSFYRYVVSLARLGQVHSFKVLAVSSTGLKLDLGGVTQVTSTPTKKTTPPSSVESLSIDITGEVLQLVWPQIQDCDTREYLIRYSPEVTDNWTTSVPLLRIDRNGTLASTQARTGIYLIKAVDYNGNESTTAAAAITTIPNLFNLNVIEETTDFPELDGTFDRTVSANGTLLLQTTVAGGVNTQEYASEGYYYYKDLLDLGEIYSVRLQSLIRAEGYTLQDVMANWNPLASVTALSNAGSSDWDVEAQYRSTNQLNVIADWVTLASINPISEGVQNEYTPWRKFIMGDATGRIFQFRLRLMSNKVSVTPRVFDGTIRADMPDRAEAFDNLVAPATGYVFNYDPPFAGPGSTPAIQISIDGAQTGDYWNFDYRTLNGFKIRFYDKNNNPVVRTFDVALRGYGRKSTVVI